MPGEHYILLLHMYRDTLALYVGHLVLIFNVGHAEYVGRAVKTCLTIEEALQEAHPVSFREPIHVSILLACCA
jgi:hypothetical protein